MLQRIRLSCMFVLLAAAPSASQVLHVDDNAPGDPGPFTPLVSDPLEDGSLAHPFDALAEALAAALPGSTILLADGVYQGPGNRDLDPGGKDLVIKGTGSPTHAVINAQGLGRVFRFGSGETSATRLEGLVLANGSASLGGAVRVEGGSSPTLVRCIITGSGAVQGGGVSVHDATLTLQDCVLRRNTAAGSGGGLALTGSAQVLLDRATLQGNVAAAGGGVSAEGTSVLTVSGSVCWGDSAALGSELRIADQALATVSWSNLAGGAAGASVAPLAVLNWGPGNQDSDPLFLDSPMYDLHLHQDSPCRDAGDPDLVVGPEDGDMDAEPRIWGAAVDQGADEIVCRPGAPSDCNGNGMDDRCEADCNGSGKPGACDISSGASKDINGDGVPDECFPWITVRVNDNAPFDPGPGDPGLSDPQEDGGDSHPFDSLQEAIVAAMPFDFVVVQPGTYTGVGNRDVDFLGKNVNLTGQDGPEGVVLDAQGLGRHLRFGSGELHGAHVKGFTLLNGVAIEGGSVLTENDSGPQIVECIFRSNSAVRGGAVAFGGGNETLRNCVLSENTASEVGGAVWISSADGAFLRGCTLANNSAGQAGGGVAATDAQGVKLRGDILWANSAPSGAQLSLEQAAFVSVFYTLMQDGKPGVPVSGGSSLSWAGTNLSLDPGFLDLAGGDLHIGVGSPCIDTGFPGYVPQPGETDIDLDPRIQGGRQDMGADEVLCQTDLGFSGPGAVRLDVCGDALSKVGGATGLLLSGAAASAPVFLVLGDAFGPTSIKGGVLVPVPWLLLVSGLVTDGGGKLLLTLPGGLGPYLLYLQAVVPNGTVFEFSNAVSLEA